MDLKLLSSNFDNSPVGPMIASDNSTVGPMIDSVAVAGPTDYALLIGVPVIAVTATILLIVIMVLRYIAHQKGTYYTNEEALAFKCDPEEQDITESAEYPEDLEEREDQEVEGPEDQENQEDPKEEKP